MRGFKFLEICSINRMINKFLMDLQHLLSRAHSKNSNLSAQTTIKPLQTTFRIRQKGLFEQGLSILELAGLGITLFTLFLWLKKITSIHQEKLLQILGLILAKPLVEKKTPLINDLLNMIIKINDISEVTVSQNGHSNYKREKFSPNTNFYHLTQNIWYKNRNIGILRIKFYKFK
jgi:hypothetical protein